MGPRFIGMVFLRLIHPIMMVCLLSILHLEVILHTRSKPKFTGPGIIPITVRSILMGPLVQSLSIGIFSLVRYIRDGQLMNS